MSGDGVVSGGGIVSGVTVFFLSSHLFVFFVFLFSPIPFFLTPARILLFLFRAFLRALLALFISSKASSPVVLEVSESSAVEGLTESMSALDVAAAGGSLLPVPPQGGPVTVTAVSEVTKKYTKYEREE